MRPSRCQADAGPRRPRILHVVNALDGGGMERTLLAVVGATLHGRLEHAICTLRGPGPLADRVPPSVPLLCLRARDRSRATSLRLARVIARYRPDLVHARSWGVWTDTVLANAVMGARPLLLGFHGLDAKPGFSRSDRCRAYVMRRWSRRFACVSHAGRDQLHRELGIPADRIAVIPNGVDTRRFAPPSRESRAERRAAMGFPPCALVAGTVGNLTPVKDHATMLRAVRFCRDAGVDLRLIIAGEGALRDELEHQATDLGIGASVRFAGPCGDVPALLGAMDLYVCSSRSEGMSNAILEAMAVGLPIVATAVGDNARLIDNGKAGELVAPADAQALGGAMVRLARCESRRAALGSAARARAAEQYPFARCVQRHLDLYHSLIGPLR